MSNKQYILSGGFMSGRATLLEALRAPMDDCEFFHKELYEDGHIHESYCELEQTCCEGILCESKKLRFTTKILKDIASGKYYNKTFVKHILEVLGEN